jgi:cyclic pyranopterin monophosphate synthase
MSEPEKNQLSHVDGEGKAKMVDVGAKPPVQRSARAAGRILLAPETVERIRENSIKKGDVLTVAQIAGIQAAKQTHHLIPLCHPIALSSVDVECRILEVGVEVEARARCIGPTGVEMEALTAVSVALLTIYDMCKAVDKKMVMESVRLLEKKKEPLQ